MAGGRSSCDPWRRPPWFAHYYRPTVITTHRRTYHERDLTMKLRFAVDQAEAFRQGVDCPKSIITIEVDPANIPQDERNLIADRLHGGIDVCRGEIRDGDKVTPIFSFGEPARIIAALPTFEALMQTVRADERELRGEGESSPAGADWTDASAKAVRAVQRQQG
jgi:hypothetical protein